MGGENVYLPSLMMEVPDHLYVLGDTYTSHVNKVQLIRVKMICVAVIRTFQPIVVQKMWMLAVVLTTYV
jgi:hypothetical protein